MPQSQCQISVVIPLYNSASTLPRAVESVLQQTLQDWELLIIDDASTDGSLAQARALGDENPRIRIVALTENRGKSRAMNVALPQAHGAWIAVLDADDWYEPSRLATLIAAGETRGVELVADNQRFWDADANLPVRTAFPETEGDRLLTRQVFSSGSDPYAEFDYGMLKPVVRTDFIRRTAVRYRENARLSEDFLHLLDLFAAGGTGFLVADPLYNWTQPFGSVSRHWTATGGGNWRYDYQSALAAHGDALRELQQRQDEVLIHLVTARIRAFKRLHHLNKINRMRRSGTALSRILLEIARHPSIWSQLVLRLMRVLRYHGGAIDGRQTVAFPLRWH